MTTPTLKPHQLAPNPNGGFTCSVCGKTYKTNNPRIHNTCPGVKYYNWGQWGDLMTKKQISDAGYQTGKQLPAPAGAVYREKSPNGIMWLYDPAQAEKKRVVSEEDKAAAKTAREQANLCPRCQKRSRMWTRYSRYKGRTRSTYRKW